MRLKRYRAANMAAAMAAVRAELGGDAMILDTRRLSDGVEVTAGVDAAPPEISEPDRANMLAWHGVPSALAARLHAGPLAFALQVALRFTVLNHATPLMLVGPPGAGKTMTIVRIATRLVLAGHRPLVITTDGARAGALEQLEAFTRLLGIETITAATTPAHDGPVLIDTEGGNPFDPAGHAERAGIAAACNATQALVLPAGIDPLESRDIAAAFAAAGTKLLIASKTDISRRLGSVLAAADIGLALTEAGIGPGAADGLVPLTPAWLAERLAQRGDPAR